MLQRSSVLVVPRVVSFIIACVKSSFFVSLCFFSYKNCIQFSSTVSRSALGGHDNVSCDPSFHF